MGAAGQPRHRAGSQECCPQTLSSGPPECRPAGPQPHLQLLTDVLATHPQWVPGQLAAPVLQREPTQHGRSGLPEKAPEALRALQSCPPCLSGWVLLDRLHAGWPSRCCHPPGALISHDKLLLQINPERELGNMSYKLGQVSVSGGFPSLEQPGHVPLLSSLVLVCPEFGPLDASRKITCIF